jgi:CO/xanthine dehydrogenase Mo-binding subunit
VAAETPQAAEGALAPITATYEKLPAVADQEAAMKDAPRLHDEVPSNWPLADLR